MTFLSNRSFSIVVNMIVNHANRGFLIDTFHSVHGICQSSQIVVLNTFVLLPCEKCKKF